LGYSTGDNNRLLSDGTYDYEYDDEGNRTKRTKISDSSHIEYAWDHRNRLTEATFKTSGGSVTKRVAYVYDQFDRRIGKRVDANGDGTYDTAERYVYDGEDVVFTFLDSDGDGSGTASLSARVLQGPGTDQAFAVEVAGGGAVRWSLADNQGTIRDVAEYNSGTNTTSVVNHIKYDAYGNITAQSDSTKQPFFAYTGREWDGDVGLFYYRARWYDAGVGRFISEDPISCNAGDTNINRYVGNSSVNCTDPSGLEVKFLGDKNDIKEIKKLMDEMRVKAKKNKELQDALTKIDATDIVFTIVHKSTQATIGNHQLKLLDIDDIRAIPADAQALTRQGVLLHELYEQYLIINDKMEYIDAHNKAKAMESLVNGGFATVGEDELVLIDSDQAARRVYMGMDGTRVLVLVRMKADGSMDVKYEKTPAPQ